MENQELMKKSFKFIEKNMHITNYQLPEELLRFWQVDDPVEYLNDENGDKSQYTIFMYALMLYHKNKGKMQFDMKVDKLYDYFYTFQTLLAFAEISRKTDITIKPIKLFDFGKYDKIKVEAREKNFFDGVSN